MKRPLIIILLLAVCFSSYAQPWMPATGGRVKFDDAVARYVPVVEDEEEREHEKEKHRGKEVREDGNYQFERWCWYWKQHLDTQG